MSAPKLFDQLVCPKSRQPLVYVPAIDDDAAWLVCPASRLRYRIEAGVPVMLVEEAEEMSEADVRRLVARAAALGVPVPA